MTAADASSPDLLDRVLALSTRRLILLVLAIAALLRLPLALVDFYNHPDEIWQYLEPAYGMITGRSVVTWEYRLNMRSWLLPTLFVPPMWAGLAMAPGTVLPIALSRLVSAALSLLVVLFGMLIAGRFSKLHALTAGLVLAVSTELVYFSGRTSSDGLALPPFFAAAWLLLGGAPRTFRRTLVAGLMLGLCFAVRFQLAPALATLALGCCLLDRRAWAPLAAGGLAGVAIDAAVNALHGQAPLAWMLNNFRLNLVDNASARYGIEPPFWYLTDRVDLWGPLTLPLLALIAIGARRLPVLLAVAVVNLAAHSLIPHKEFRFLLLTDALFLLLAAIGTADIARWAIGRRRRGGLAILMVGGGFWVGASAVLAFNDPRHERWNANRVTVALFRDLRSRPEICGVAYYKPVRALLSTAYIQRPLPLSYFDEHARADLLARRRMFNALLAPITERVDADTGYTRQRCYDGLQGTNDCLYTRPGGCAPATDRRFDINTVLQQQGR